MDFNFPKKAGTGIEQRLVPCKTTREGIRFINDCCVYDPDERRVPFLLYLWTYSMLRSCDFSTVALDCLQNKH